MTKANDGGPAMSKARQMVMKKINNSTLGSLKFPGEWKEELADAILTQAIKAQIVMEYCKSKSQGIKMTKPQSFKSFLIDKHARQYTGLDDEMPEDFSEWLAGLDPETWIEYAEKWRGKWMKS